MLTLLLACLSPEPADEPAGDSGTTATLDSGDSGQDSGRDSGGTASALTWNGAVAPLVAEHCAGCHSDGNIGPFALTSFEAAAPMAAAMAAAVAARTMPPWRAAEGCTDYEADISLSSDEIATFVAWADAGAPVGEGEPVQADPTTVAEGLPRVDVSLTVPEPYTPAGTTDDYRCFVLDWPYEEEVFVTGFRAAPDVVEEVHHVIAFIAPPEFTETYRALDAAEEGSGYTCYGGPGGESLEEVGWLGAWAPGGEGGAYPDGTGIYMEPGSKVVLQLHYNLEATDALPDQTAVEFMVEDSVEREALMQPWTDPSWLDGDGMDIPAGTEDVTHGFSYPLPFPLTLYTAGLHLHELGQSGRLYIDRTDGSEDCMLDIPDWDFHWQRTYRFTEPKIVEAGDAIAVECTWDNPGDADVDWGEGTSDEMCLGFMYMTWE